MSDLFEPYTRLIPLTILGRTFEVPENNLLLRQMSFVADDIAWGRYCWNGECRYCEVTYRRESDGVELTALACRTRGVPGMTLTKLAPEIKYNMAAALSGEKPAE